MLDFVDEFSLDAFKIPGLLIWIQLFLLLLFLAFIFCFTIIASDPSHSNHNTSTADSLSSIHSTTVTLNTNPLHITRGVENLSIEGEIRTSREVVREGIAEGEATSLYFLHPCYYFKLARVAFLKCFGFDSTSESDNPSTQNYMGKKKDS
uniref:Uncharacterized protein LOC101490830 n=1 Tax=Cicer arietinum TaxID=3827 RepID=A0A1S2YGH0_CICAR|nr:uncharacterized protein LOC101490830 [Cicer arietinum]